MYVHLRFSERGDYQLVRFSVNKALLSCANCVKNKDMDEERYELELAKVKDTLAKKESTVKQVEKDANSFGYWSKWGDSGGWTNFGLNPLEQQYNSWY